MARRMYGEWFGVNGGCLGCILGVDGDLKVLFGG